MTELIYPELSYRLVGVSFEIFNTLGFGHKEIYYQKAFEKELSDRKIQFKREPRQILTYKGCPVGVYIPDFIIEDKLLLELRVRPKLGYSQVKQVLNYLKGTGLKLGLLIYFTKEGVKYRRILNAY